MITDAEREHLRDVARATYRPLPPTETFDDAECWTRAVAHGFTDLAGEADALAVLLEEAGRAASALPLADAYIAQTFIDDPDLHTAVSQGTISLTVVFGSAEPLGDTDLADHVLRISLDGHGATLHPITGRRHRPGLARPSWSHLSLGDAKATYPIDAAAAVNAQRLLRWALTRRALGAVRATTEEALAHAKTRTQFGRVIGAFGAVQQRAAEIHIDLLAIDALLEQVSVHPHRDADPLALELALAFAEQRLPQVLFDAHHTLAATGYFEEHPAPHRFRRAHADLARVADLGDSAGIAASMLLSDARGLPAIEIDDAERTLREGVREVIRAHADDRERLLEEAARRGWFSRSWPANLGGTDASAAEVSAISEELRYSLAPLDRPLTAQFLIGSSLVRHGSVQQQRELLPLITRGEMRVALGYSEPESGSDLASLRTQAVRDHDDWVINGQKIWSTYADDSNYYWLATRTSTGARPQAGITMFLVPMDTPGIEVTPIVGLSGARSAIVSLTDVRVSDEHRVGAVDDGWRVITDALAGERADMGGVAATIHRGLDDLVAVLRAQGAVPDRELGRMAARVHASRLLARQAVLKPDDPIAAPAAAVFAGQLAEDFSLFAMRAAGLESLMEDGAGEGRFERLLRLSIMYVVGGGTNDVLKGLIARRLGLPRE